MRKRKIYNIDKKIQKKEIFYLCINEDVCLIVDYSNLLINNFIKEDTKIIECNGQLNHIIDNYQLTLKEFKIEDCKHLLVCCNGVLNTYYNN